MGPVLLFFRTGLGKGIIGIVILTFLFAGTYAQGHRSGYDTGKKAGIKSQKPKIDRLEGIINTAREAIAAKTSKIEINASEGAISAKAVLAVNEVVRIKIVDHYHETERLVASQCGLSESSAITINSLLDTQIVYGEPEVQPTPEVRHEPVL